MFCVPNFGTFFVSIRERGKKMKHEERKNRKNTTFEDLTKDIQMTEGEIFLSISFVEGGEADEE